MMMKPDFECSQLVNVPHLTRNIRPPPFSECNADMSANEWLLLTDQEVDAHAK